MPGSPSASTSSSSRASSPTAPPIVQPDHFYGSENAPISPRSDGKAWLDPDDDPSASRGIPVFKPTMDEFRDFEGYMKKVECWGMKSGIVKIVPPKEWKDSLSSVTDKLADVRLNHPIEQHMVGRAGLFRQKNVEAYKKLSVREWAELCEKDDYRAPGVDEVGPRHAPRASGRVHRKQQRKQTTVEPVSPLATPVIPTERLASEPPAVGMSEKAKGKRRQTHAEKVAKLEVRATLDRAFFEDFDPDTRWLPAGTSAQDYTPDFCSELERQYWRNLGFGKPAQYGADMAGSLFSDPKTPWNVACLPSALERLMPREKYPTQGVNMPYLYFGMWRATFAWHVEDCDLFSINYIHFGAPKHWYAVPQARADAFEGVMRGFFSEGQGSKACPQFLRHKAFLVSPTILAKSSCRPNTLVQHAGEFVVTYPRGYHAGFNLGFNCAESANFALDSWLERGRNARVCECVDDAVRIDVDSLLAAREEDKREEEARRMQPAPVLAPALARAPAPALARAPAPAPVPVARPMIAIDPALLMGQNQQAHQDKPPPLPMSLTLPPPPSVAPAPAPKPPRKRKSDEAHSGTQSKKSKTAGPSSSAFAQPQQKVTLKLPPRPVDDSFACCLCASANPTGLLPVRARATGSHAAWANTRGGEKWMAHENCAMVVPETWVDVVGESGEKTVFGVDAIVKDRWNLRCMACKSTRAKQHGAPVQCTKGRCPKAYHVSCARDTAEIDFALVREMEKEIPAGPPVSVGEGYPPVVPVRKVKKWEARVFCAQHNPAAIAAKQSAKEDKLRTAMLALAPGSRVKVRVSSGVFEVSLVCVDADARTLDVLWDRAIQRSFKWGSVVFDSRPGDAFTVIGQQPANAQYMPPPIASGSSTPYGHYPQHPQQQPQQHPLYQPPVPMQLPPQPPAPLPMSPHMADWLARQKLAAAGVPLHQPPPQQPYIAGSMQPGAWTYGQQAMGVGAGGVGAGFGAPFRASGAVVAEPGVAHGYGQASGSGAASGSGSGSN
ncbi:JmjC-domain-containing protein [Peniophora sp. CONT]|nr:JmjC-domain-containing protein [Peniophora sp. CONT]